ncbi:C4-dicarboxylate ABC transporter substrate-binding protein [Fulvimarina endophytica]|uniref:C4-dicarboxylate ABC transporter substrate-binding protein n=1 Tax=Fulvimarina endophytica TaxID=2293836 RepID=A0A371WZL0_9HYPH|nr:TRAP transporter substrate-binding protein [Fulvimarina endophytica]RFC62224.1 C4-dicarboxylate ABC transporter substrate-binding protein [Fulvimarina endophytica]
MTLKSLIVGALFATTALSASALSAKEMNFAIVTPPEGHYGLGAKAFAEKMNELSNGEFTINVMAGGSLGGERELLEGEQIGTIDLAMTSTGPVGSFVPEIYALDFPFLFKDYDSARTILDGEIGKELLVKFEDKGIIGLGWSENGFRHITNSVKPIRTPEDVQGLKLRTMENQVHIDAFQELGASPTPMSWTEVLTSLQQGTIDGQENPVPIITSNNMWDMQKYVTLTGHVYSPAVITMSKIQWDQLSDEEKGWIEEATKAAVSATRAKVDEDEANGVALMKEHGMEVIEDVDKQAFQDAVQPTYERYGAEYGEEMIQRIRDAQK